MSIQIIFTVYISYRFSLVNISLNQDKKYIGKWICEIWKITLGNYRNNVIIGILNA